MKIPFLPIHLMGSKKVAEQETSLAVRASEISRLMDQVEGLVHYINTLPMKYWPKQWAKRAG